MSERREADLAALHALLLQSAAEGIYGLNADGVTTFVNPAAQQILGYSEAELVGRHQHETIHHSFSDGTPHPIESCPIERALRRGEIVHSPVETFWTSAGEPVSVELTATPLPDPRDGRSSNGVVITFSDIRERLDAERQRLELERARAAEAAAFDALHELQRAMQPAPLLLPGVELAADYRPALDAAAGGDLYDWLLLPDGRVFAAVVDVLGKGVAAAKDALAVTHALRLLALRGTAIGDLLREADELLVPALPELIATAVVAIFDPETRALEVVSGGHPPALLVHRATAAGAASSCGGAACAGSSCYLEASGRPIGYPLPGSDDVVRVRLDLGDALVLYTDGLIEGNRDVPAGLRRLQEIVQQHQTLPAAELATAAVADAVRDAVHLDDALCVVLRAA